MGRKLKTERGVIEKKRERNEVVKRREKTRQKYKHAVIDYLFPPLANPLFGIPKVVTSSHLGQFPKMHNFDGKSL